MDLKVIETKSFNTLIMAEGVLTPQEQWDWYVKAFLGIAYEQFIECNIINEGKYRMQLVFEKLEISE